MKQDTTNKGRQLFLLIMVVITVQFIIVYQFNFNYFSAYITSLMNSTNSSSKYLIYTPGCKILNLHPFDKSILTFIEDPEKKSCNNGIPPLFASNLSSIYLLIDSIPYYNISNVSELKCNYRYFWRADPTNENEPDNQIKYSTNYISFVNETKVEEEFVAVHCYYKARLIYKDMFSFVPTAKINKFQKKKIKNSFNVLIIGLDAISRLNLHRQMPKTVDFLTDNGAIELLGYNKVGDNTFPNLIPVLTGKSESELRDECWPNNEAYFDNCSFIWNDFKTKGYVTAYGEDSTWMGLFNYQKNGFKFQPTDYAYNYFNREAETELGNNHFGNADLCEGGRWIYKDLLKYSTQFILTMLSNSFPFFGFFWENSLTHDDLNMPKLGDEEYYSFFKNLKNRNVLNNTILFILSDHGIRWGEIRNTYQGRIEERLPFLFILLPDSFTRKYKQAAKNLFTNSQRLTSPYDTHETLIDLVNLNYSKNILMNVKKQRGISLFKEISSQRTCEDAGISAHWCACRETVEIEVENALVTKATDFVLSYIHSRLINYTQCANLTLESILNAQVLKSDQETRDNFQDYMVTFRTIPGEGIFEATVRYRVKKNNFIIIGTVSRLNLYGEQSICISDFHLKLYCFCKYTMK